VKAQQKKGKVITPQPRKPMPDKTKQLLNYRKAMNKATAQGDRASRDALLKARIAEKFGA
jgi:hypothetical protein